MSIKYLGKLRPIDFQDNTSYVQMVNVPELQYQVRCAYCHYFEQNRTMSEWQDCAIKRKCGYETLFFLPMVNLLASKPNIDRQFSITPVTKQITIDNQKRYLQLFSSDIQGYECNQLCQYYPSRIAAEQSVAECANSHACGRNGSFWDLLVPKYPYLSNFPDIKNDIIDDTTVVTLDGRVIEGVTIVSITVDDDRWVKANLSDGTSWYIANMYWESVMSGQLLRARRADNPKLWEWQNNGVLYNRASESIIITADTEPLYQKLIEMGYPEENFYRPLKDLWLISVSSSGSSWFVNDWWHFEDVIADGYHVIILLSYLNNTRYVVKFGTSGTIYLASKFEDEPKSSWLKANVPNLSTTDYHVVTLTSYVDQMAQWLMTIGVRQSLFFFK